MPSIPHRSIATAVEAVASRRSSILDTAVAAAARIAERRGAVAAVVDEARSRVDLPVQRRLFMIRWATDVGRNRPLRRGFRPGQHLRSADAREAARRALVERIATLDDEPAREQLIGLAESPELGTLLDLVSRDLQQRIADRAVRPKRGAGIDPHALLPIVAEVNSRLSEHGIRPFLMSGTLLGFIRNGTFLEHDHDVDLGILPETELDEVAHALAGSGLELSVGLENRWLVGVHQSGLHIDFFRHEFRDGRFWHATRVHDWWNTPFELRELEAHGHRWWIPDPPERYLDENYGAWSAPVAFYDISFDTPNRTYQPTTAAAQQLYLACIRGLDNGDRWMVESAARELRDQFGVDVTHHLADTPLLRSHGPR
jgi:hypothetical protein